MRAPSSPSDAAPPSIVAAGPPTGADQRGASRGQLGRSDRRPGHDAQTWRSLGRWIDRLVHDVGSFLSVALRGGGARFDAHPFAARTGLSRQRRPAGSSAAGSRLEARDVHDARDHAGRHGADAAVPIRRASPPEVSWELGGESNGRRAGGRLGQQQRGDRAVRAVGGRVTLTVSAHALPPPRSKPSGAAAGDRPRRFADCRQPMATRNAAATGGHPSVDVRWPIT